MKVRTRVEALVHPTEDEAKVVAAISNVFDAKNYVKEDRGEYKVVYCEAEGMEPLEKLRNLLRRERILDAARRMILAGRKGNTLTFYLNKQAAYVGHASFCKPERESPLGPITFHIECDDIDKLVDWLATKTIGGVPVDEL